MAQIAISGAPMKPRMWGWSSQLVHPRARGVLRRCVALMPMWEGGGNTVNLVDRTILTLQANGAWAQGRYGWHGKMTSASGQQFAKSNYNPVQTSNGAGTGDFTMLAWATPAAAASVKGLISQRVQGGNFNQANLFANSLNAGASSGAIELYTYDSGASALSVASRVNGLPHVWIGTRSGASPVLTLYEDGVQIGSASTTAKQVTSGTGGLAIGGGSGTTIWPCVDPIHLIAGWDRALTATEIAWIGNNPAKLIAEWFDDDEDVAVPGVAPTSAVGYGLLFSQKLRRRGLAA